MRSLILCLKLGSTFVMRSNNCCSAASWSSAVSTVSAVSSGKILSTRLSALYTASKFGVKRNSASALARLRISTISTSPTAKTASARSGAYCCVCINMTRRRSLMKFRVLVCVSSANATLYRSSAFWTTASKERVRFLSWRIRMVPRACRLNEYGSCEPVGRSSIPKYPTIVSILSAIATIAPASVSGSGVSAPRG